MMRSAVWNEYSENSAPLMANPRFYTPVNQYKQFFQNETKSHEKQVSRPSFR